MDTPPLTLIDHKDIQIFQGPVSFSADPFYCSSLGGQREINDVFAILDMAVRVGSSNKFALREINDSGMFLSTVYERGAPGTFKPGSYIIVPQEDGEEVLRRQMITFASGVVEMPRQKKAKVSDMGTEGSAVSTRDDDPQGFKMRLAYRDKGCVVCHAEPTDSIYQYCDDSRFFEGSHIFPFARQTTWTLRGYHKLIVDPYTATRVENTTRNKQDPLRINSLENGILLCLFHHKAYDTFRFSIHPETHKIFSFHPAVAHIHGLQVTSPWNAPNTLYPSPHNELLKVHFQTSIFASLSADAEPLDEDEDEDNDDNDEPELPSNHDNEAVRIWADDPNRYPPAEWRLDNEEQDKSTAEVSNGKDVEIPLSDFRSLAVV